MLSYYLADRIVVICPNNWGPDNVDKVLFTTTTTASGTDASVKSRGALVAEEKDHSICLVTIETRPYENITKLSEPSELHEWTMNSLYHSYYAKRHGYKFTRIRAESLKSKGLKDMWAKPSSLRRFVSRCEYTVFLDADAYIRDPSIPLEKMMERWGFGKLDTQLMLAAYDPQDWQNYARTGLQFYRNVNTGFMILRRHPKTIELLQKWESCPFEIPGCEVYKKEDFQDQGAFNKFIRPLMKEKEEFVILDCEEANGFEGKLNCYGKFVVHAWYRKNEIAERIGKILLRDVLAHLNMDIKEIQM